MTDDSTYTDPPLNRRVRVYYDSTRRIWSVVENGRVIYKSHHLRLRDCQFVVREKIRDRVRRTRVKDPHAYVCGKLVSFYEPLPAKRFVRFRYNPYTTDGFETIGGAKIMASADEVALSILQEGRVDLRAYGACYLRAEDVAVDRD